MTEMEAVKTRISCRSYQDRPIARDALDLLSAKIKELNEVSGLHFQLITTPEPTLKLAGAMFVGPVTTYAALVGGTDPISSEKVGYYGQQLVLYATQLGLGTCWVAGTYDAKSARAEIPAGEKLWDVIPMGYATESIPMKQKMIRATIRSRDRKLEQFVESTAEFEFLPQWIRTGAEAVKMGPSAVNQQPMNIVYKDGKVFARLWKDGKALQYNDMGIAKYQFQVGAAAAGVKGTWDFGDGAEFHIG